MNIEQEGYNIIKATLEWEDLRRFGVTFESIKCRDKNTRKMYEEILSIARERYECTLDISRIMVTGKKIEDIIILYFF
jgi:hypothetical protein